MKRLTPAALIQAVREVLCKHRGHQWRKARKGEAQTMKYCARCKAGAVIRKRALREHDEAQTK